jgi:HAD superfamily hydrolase (TIGR01450 family)
LIDGYDGLLTDLDGVVYIGARAVPQAVETLSWALQQGYSLSFVTNNAARTPNQVADHLSELGLPTVPEQVTTSAQAAAAELAGRLAPGSRVLVVGGEGVRVALRQHGLQPVERVEQDPAAVVQGFAPEVDWSMLAEGTLGVLRGLPWIATNLDRTIPTPRGLAPGNGALVGVIVEATGRHPESVGKPAAGLLQVAARRGGAARPLVIGDRLDTDIAAANAAQLPSLLVLTGVTRPVDLLAAPPQQRPTYLGADLRSLRCVAPGVQQTAQGWTCRGWQLDLAGTRLTRLERQPSTEPAHQSSPSSPTTAGQGDTSLFWADDGLDALRVVAAASWQRADAGQPALPSEVVAPALEVPTDGTGLGVPCHRAG